MPRLSLFDFSKNMEGSNMRLSEKNATMAAAGAAPKKQAKSKALYVKISPEEKAKIERNMALVGIANASAFVRRMCLDGGIFKIEMPEIREVSRLMSITANNVNQLARRANSGGHACREDVARVGAQLAECRELFGKVMAKLAKF
jgi:hypothetical protein